MYLARRYETDEFECKQRKVGYFNSVEEARSWQSFLTAPLLPEVKEINSRSRPVSGQTSPLFGDLIGEWKSRKYPGFSGGTKVHYDQLIDLHFNNLLEIPVANITPRTVDAWLADRKANIGATWQSRIRKSFDHELTLLTVILRYYGEYHDEDTAFRLPIKNRHRQDSKLNISLPTKQKDITEIEFYKFRSQLECTENGLILAALATVQFFQALRISEAAGLFWDDVKLNWKEPKDSRVLIVRHIVFSRKRGMASEIVPGFKNSKANGGTKELPIFPPTFEALKKLHVIGKKGLIFHNKSGDFFEYSLIRTAYNRAFKKAGLPYTATHVMRHGWTREILNATNGDFTVAGQLLGNTDMETIQVYAKRHKGALTEVAHEQWTRHDKKIELIANGRNSKSIEGNI